MKTRITRNTIEVTRSVDGKRFFFYHKFEGVLPGCRTEAKLTPQACEGKIILRPLFNYNASDEISVEEYRALIRSAVVVSSKLNDIEINPTIENFARIDIESICDCPAVNPTKFTDSEKQDWYYKMVREQNARSMDIVERNRQKRYGSK